MWLLEAEPKWMDAFKDKWKMKNFNKLDVIYFPGKVLYQSAFESWKSNETLYIRNTQNTYQCGP